MDSHSIQQKTTSVMDDNTLYSCTKQLQCKEHQWCLMKIQAFEYIVTSHREREESITYNGDIPFPKSKEGIVLLSKWKKIVEIERNALHPRKLLRRLLQVVEHNRNRYIVHIWKQKQFLNTNYTRVNTLASVLKFNYHWATELNRHGSQWLNVTDDGFSCWFRLSFRPPHFGNTDAVLWSIRLSLLI